MQSRAPRAAEGLLGLSATAQRNRQFLWVQQLHVSAQAYFKYPFGEKAENSKVAFHSLSCVLESGLRPVKKCSGSVHTCAQFWPRWFPDREARWCSAEDHSLAVTKLAAPYFTGEETEVGPRRVGAIVESTLAQPGEHSPKTWRALVQYGVCRCGWVFM